MCATRWLPPAGVTTQWALAVSRRASNEGEPWRRLVALHQRWHGSRHIRTWLSYHRLNASEADMDGQASPESFHFKTPPVFRHWFFIQWHSSLGWLLICKNSIYYFQKTAQLSLCLKPHIWLGVKTQGIVAPFWHDSLSHICNHMH